MQSYKLSQAEVIRMLARKANLPEDVTKVLLQANVAPVTDDTQYCNDRGASLGRPPLLKSIDPILNIEPQLLMLSGYGEEIVAAIQTPVEILGVEIWVPVYFCELEHVKQGLCLIVDSFKFYKKEGGAWQLYIS